MGVFTGGKRVVAMAALLAGLGASQGCVALGTHEDDQRKIEALTNAYKGADDLVARLKSQIEAQKGQIAQAQAEAAAANARSGQKDLALDAKYKSLQEQYAKMLDDLKSSTGNDISVNPQSHGAVLSDDIFFSPGKAELRGEKLVVLDKLIEKLKTDFGAAQIEIAGHTDPDPITKSGWKDNFQLSAERARNILVYFKTKGVPEERMHISGYAATRPLGTTKAQCRRVEVVLFETGQKG